MGSCRSGTITACSGATPVGFGGRRRLSGFVLRWSEFDVAQSSLVGEVESAGRRLTQLELIVEILQEAGVDIRN